MTDTSVDQATEAFGEAKFGDSAQPNLSKLSRPTSLDLQSEGRLQHANIPELSTRDREFLRLEVDPENLEADICQIAAQLGRVGELYSHAVRATLTAKNELERLEGLYSLVLRHKAVSTGQSRPVAAVIDACVARIDLVKRAKAQYTSAQVTEKAFRNLMRAFEAKERAIDLLARQRTAEARTSAFTSRRVT
jgi:hypothetical protein